MGELLALRCDPMRRAMELPYPVSRVCRSAAAGGLIAMQSIYRPMPGVPLTSINSGKGGATSMAKTDCRAHILLAFETIGQ
jgi:hypothetical protein